MSRRTSSRSILTTVPSMTSPSSKEMIESPIACSRSASGMSSSTMGGGCSCPRRRRSPSARGREGSPGLLGVSGISVAVCRPLDATAPVWVATCNLRTAPGSCLVNKGLRHRRRRWARPDSVSAADLAESAPHPAPGSPVRLARSRRRRSRHRPTGSGNNDGGCLRSTGAVGGPRTAGDSIRFHSGRRSGGPLRPRRRSCRDPSVRRSGRRRGGARRRLRPALGLLALPFALLCSLFSFPLLDAAGHASGRSRHAVVDGVRRPRQLQPTRRGPDRHRHRRHRHAHRPRHHAHADRRRSDRDDRLRLERLGEHPHPDRPGERHRPPSDRPPGVRGLGRRGGHFPGRINGAGHRWRQRRPVASSRSTSPAAPRRPPSRSATRPRVSPSRRTGPPPTSPTTAPSTASTCPPTPWWGPWRWVAARTPSPSTRAARTSTWRTSETPPSLSSRRRPTRWRRRSPWATRPRVWP